MLSVNTLKGFLILLYIRQFFCYNTNRQVVLVKDNCDYYENPVFQVAPNFLQNRMKDVEPNPQMVLLSNRLTKENPYYNVYQKAEEVVDPSKYQSKVPTSLYPNMTPVNLMQFDKTELLSQEDDKEEEEEPNVDYDKLWKVGEIPESRSVQALPDVYVKPGDAPPIVDMLSMEKSELTEETHDLENVEIEEKYLKDPLSETKEVIIEKVTTRPEPPSTANPALAIFKEIDLSKIKKEKEEGDVEEVSSSTNSTKSEN